MISNVITDKEWITLKEASKLTGRSVQALRLLINRKRIDKVKKMQDNGPGYWVIHRDVIPLISMISMDDKDTSQPILSDTHQAAYHDTSHHVIIPAEVYERQQKEHDNMVQGLMMYRYKFEEMEQQMRLLPAPVEVVASKLDELEKKAAALEQAENIIQQAQETQKHYEEEMEQLKLKLQEEEHAKEAFRIQWELSQAELKRPWWQRLWQR